MGAFQLGIGLIGKTIGIRFQRSRDQIAFLAPLKWQMNRMADGWPSELGSIPFREVYNRKDPKVQAKAHTLQVLKTDDAKMNVDVDHWLIVDKETELH